MKNRNAKYDILYIVMFLFFAVLVVGTVCAYKGPGLADDFFGQETDYAKGLKKIAK